jgi:hypothetical protein
VATAARRAWGDPIGGRAGGAQLGDVQSVRWPWGGVWGSLAIIYSAVQCSAVKACAVAAAAMPRADGQRARRGI